MKRLLILLLALTTHLPALLATVDMKTRKPLPQGDVEAVGNGHRIVHTAMVPIWRGDMLRINQALYDRLALIRHTVAVGVDEA